MSRGYAQRSASLAGTALSFRQRQDEDAVFFGPQQSSSNTVCDYKKERLVPIIRI